MNILLLAFRDADRIDVAHRVIDMTEHIRVSLQLSTYWLRYLTSVGIARCLRFLLAHTSEFLRDTCHGK
jgi:hypothetical protein